MVVFLESGGCSHNAAALHVFVARAGKSPMTSQSTSPVRFARGGEGTRLARRLASEIDGEVLFDAASRGRYSTDASIYQVTPVGVVVPRTADAAIAAMQVALEEGVAILPRGAGTSQCGQTVGEALVIDDSRYLTQVHEVSAEARTASVAPGVVLDTLNAQLKPLGLWYPVDVSTSAQATLGGMAGNNSCGSRSLAYGNMVDRVEASTRGSPTARAGASARRSAMADPRIASSPRARRSGSASATRSSRARRRSRATWRATTSTPRPDDFNLARLLVGSEGTLAWFERIHIRLAELPRHKALGVAHFPRFYDAMDAAQHIVKLGPCAVELVDRTMLDLALSNPAFAPIVREFVRGEPDAILLVEFAAPRPRRSAGRAPPWRAHGRPRIRDAVVEVPAARQASLWDVRKAGLNIMMSMKGDGSRCRSSRTARCRSSTSPNTPSPDARFPQARHRRHLVRARLRRMPARAPGAQHEGDGAVRMRAIAEEAAELVRATRARTRASTATASCAPSGSRPSSARASTAALAEIKSWFDPAGLHEPRQDREPAAPGRPLALPLRARLRAASADRALATLDWSEWGGSRRAVEMCNNNGHCRKFDAGTMCPSYRATGNERDLTRGRANTLRLRCPASSRARTSRAMRCTRRSSSASRARAAGANARRAWTWRA
jgi:FAD/FMN-containing dehydrogenase